MITRNNSKGKIFHRKSSSYSTTVMGLDGEIEGGMSKESLRRGMLSGVISDIEIPC